MLNYRKFLRAPTFSFMLLCYPVFASAQQSNESVLSQNDEVHFKNHDLDKITFEEQVLALKELETFSQGSLLGKKTINELSKLSKKKTINIKTFADSIDRFLRQNNISHAGAYSDESSEFYDLANILVFYNENTKESKVLFGSFGPSYYGLGAWLRPLPNGSYEVTQVFSGSPAQRAGLLPGYKITDLSGNFRPASRDTSRPITYYLRITDGTKVWKKTIAPIVVKPQTYYRNLTRQSAKLLYIDGIIIGYIRLYSYIDIDDLKSVLDIVDNKFGGARGIVFDLRGGWGGTPQNLFAPLVRAFPDQTVYGSDGMQRQLNKNICKPLSVLVDSTTRSGKEILAVALKKAGVSVIGKKTAGEVLSASAQFIAGGRILVELPFLRVVVDGRVIEGTGVMPSLMSPKDDEKSLIALAARNLDKTNPRYLNVCGVRVKDDTH